MKTIQQNFPALMLAVALLAIVWSLIGHEDTLLNWFLEAVPVFIFLPILVLTFRKFQFSNWLYAIFALHIIILLVGAHYTYAKVPLGFWMEDWFGLGRNDYDKIGHFMQGFSPALAAAQILIRTTTLNSKGWTFHLSICISMTVSAIYEIFEWLVAICSPEDADSFLGAQGYIWDTQSDMFMCFIGASLAVVLYRIFYHSIEE